MDFNYYYTHKLNERVELRTGGGDFGYRSLQTRATSIEPGRNAAIAPPSRGSRSSSSSRRQPLLWVRRPSVATTASDVFSYSVMRSFYSAVWTLKRYPVAHCAHDSRIGRDAFESRPDLPLCLWDHGCERVAVIRVTGSALTWATNWPPFEDLSNVATHGRLPSGALRRGRRTLRRLLLALRLT
jgi:hypothetical protein